MRGENFSDVVNRAVNVVGYAFSVNKIKTVQVGRRVNGKPYMITPTDLNASASYTMRSPD